jgi:hypothetical protein
MSWIKTRSRQSCGVLWRRVGSVGTPVDRAERHLRHRPTIASPPEETGQTLGLCDESATGTLHSTRSLRHMGITSSYSSSSSMHGRGRTNHLSGPRSGPPPTAANLARSTSESAVFGRATYRFGEPYSARIQQRHRLLAAPRTAPTHDLPQRPRTTSPPGVRIEVFNRLMPGRDDYPEVIAAIVARLVNGDRAGAECGMAEIT